MFGFIFSWVDTIHRAHIHAGAVLGADTRLGDHISHSASPLFRSTRHALNETTQRNLVGSSGRPEDSPNKCTRQPFVSQLAPLLTTNLVWPCSIPAVPFSL